MKACMKCGSEDRNASGRCRPCMSAYSKGWNTTNKKKVAAACARWRAKNPEASKLWREANSDKIKKADAAWRIKHPDHNKKWVLANPDKRRDHNAKWASANPEKCRAKTQNRRARKINAGGKISPTLSEKLFALQRGKCACGCKQPLGDNYHRDHIMPLALGGTNTDDNIQLLRSTCNLQKSAKHPVDFMQSRGFLL